MCCYQLSESTGQSIDVVATQVRLSYMEIYNEQMFDLLDNIGRYHCQPLSYLFATASNVLLLHQVGSYADSRQ